MPPDRNHPASVGWVLCNDGPDLPAARVLGRIDAPRADHEVEARLPLKSVTGAGLLSSRTVPVEGDPDLFPVGDQRNASEQGLWLRRLAQGEQYGPVLQLEHVHTRPM